MACRPSLRAPRAPARCCVGGEARPACRQDRRDRREADEPAPHPRRARPGARLRVRLARSLHVRGRVPRAARPRAGARRGNDPPRHERRQRREHAATDHARRGRPALERRAQRGTGPVPARRGAARHPSAVPERLRLGRRDVDPAQPRAPRRAARSLIHGAAPRRALARARPVRPATATPDPLLRGGRGSCPHRAPERRDVSGPARLPRARRAERRRARVALEPAPAADPRACRPRSKGLGCLHRSGTDGDRRPPRARALPRL
jgi:hypothetical protein